MWLQILGRALEQSDVTPTRVDGWQTDGQMAAQEQLREEIAAEQVRFGFPLLIISLLSMLHTYV